MASFTSQPGAAQPGLMQPGQVGVPGAPPPPAAVFPAVSVQAQFSAGAWTDISAYVYNGTITRGSTRVQGPLITYQAGTASLLLDNTSGRFDPDNLSGPYVTTSITRTVSFNSGSGLWIAPPDITGTLKVECWGAGAGGSGPGGGAGGGGGGGEYAAEPALAILPGQSLTYSAGAPGSGSTAQGTGGGDTTFGPVTAHGGNASPVLGGGGGGGSGSTNSVHHNGGHGGTGTGAGAQGGGGGGGGSGGPGSAGHAGANSSGNHGGAGGTAVTGGGPGADGGSFTNHPEKGSTPLFAPGGGGGGGASAILGGSGRGGDGAAGQVTLTYTLTGTMSQLLPMVPIQVTATFSGTTYPLFYGYADGWFDTTPTGTGPYYSEATLNATDGFKVLAGITLPTVGVAGAGEDTGARVARLLDAARWPASQRDIATGDTTLQATTFGGDPLSLAQLATDSEAGQLYVSGDGNVTFRNRRALLTEARSTTPQAVFGDLPGTVQAAGTELFFADVTRADDDTTLANDVQATRVGGTLQEATDQGSAAQFLFPRTYARSDLIQQDDPTALQWAQWVLYVSAGAENRFDAIDVDPTSDGNGDATYPQALTQAAWAAALGREIGDRIQIWRRPPNAGTVTKDCFITGITHTFDASASTWLTSWTLASAAKYGSFFTIGDPTLGQIGLNAIAWLCLTASTHRGSPGGRCRWRRGGGPWRMATSRDPSPSRPRGIRCRSAARTAPGSCPGS